MYLNSNRDRLLKYILIILGFFSVTASLYFSYSLYFFNWTAAFFHRTFNLYHFVLFIGYLSLTFLTGLNKSFFKRRLFGEIVVVLYYVSALVIGLILSLFWFHQLADSKRLILIYFATFFIFFESLFRFFIKFVLLRVYFNSKFSSKLFVVCEQSNYSSVVEALKSNLDWSRCICGFCIVDSEPDLSTERVESVTKKSSYPLFVMKKDLLVYLTSNNVDELFIYTDSAHSDEQLKNVISNLHFALKLRQLFLKD